MNRIVIFAFASCVAVASASAHPGGHGEYEPLPTFDCSAMTGDYVAGGKKFVKVGVADSTVTFTTDKKEPVSGICVSPSIADGRYYPRAIATFAGAFGKKFEPAACCSVTLKEDKLVFDNGEIWKRRKP